MQVAVAVLVEALRLALVELVEVDLVQLLMLAYLEHRVLLELEAAVGVLVETHSLTIVAPADLVLLSWHI
jgi:hypothetical protein